jgi:hypothetical protein
MNTKQIEQIKQTMSSEKIDDYTISITRQPPTPEPTINTYSRTYLEDLMAKIQLQKDTDDAQRDSEMAEVQALLDLCDEQNIQLKPIEIQ